MSLGFSFLAPSVLYLLPLVLVPLIIHFFNRRRYTTVRWAAMEFLLRAMRRQKRRMRIESFLLVLLRMAAFACLLIACAQPMAEKEVVSESRSGNVCLVIAIDTSYSMAWQETGRTLLSEAIETAKDKLAMLDEADRLVIIDCAEYAEVIFDDHIAEDARLRAREILDSMTPSYTALDVQAMLAAIEQNRSSHEGEELPVNVLLFTDLQARDWLDAEKQADPEIGKYFTSMKEEGVLLNLYQFGGAMRDNTAVVAVERAGSLVVRDAPVVIRAVLQNFSSRMKAKRSVDLLVDGHHVQGRSLEMEPSETQTVSFRHIFRDAGLHGVTVELKPDNLGADNRRYCAVHVREEVDVLLVDGNDAVEERERATFYLDAALRRDTDEVLEVLSPFQVETVASGLLSEQMVENRDVLVFADVDRPDMVPALRNFIGRGGALLVFLGPNIEQEFYNNEFFDPERGVCAVTILGAAGDTTGQYGFLMEPQALEHPVVRFVSRQEHVQFEGPPVWRFYRLKPDEGARVITAFQDMAKSPAIVEDSRRQGVVVVVATTADEKWNNFPKWPDYVSIFHELISYQVAAGGVERALVVGRPFSSIYPAVVYAEEVRISSPFGRVTRTSLRNLSGSNNFQLLYESTGEPGLYEIVFSRRRNPDPFLKERYPARDLFAVNLPEGEGDLASASADIMQACYGEEALQFPREGGEFSGEEAKRAGKPELWRPFLFAMLLFFLAEAVCATLFGRRKR